MKKNIKNKFLLLITGLVLFSCSQEALEPTLAQANTVENAIRDVNDLRSLMNGAYNYMSDYRYYGRNLTIIGEVRADNVYANASSGRFITVAEMNLINSTAEANELWRYAYLVIANCNIVINAQNVSGNASVINHIKGEAVAIRALAHFDLVRVFGQQHVNGGNLNSLGVPYIKEFKSLDTRPSRKSVGEVKALIYQDLDNALSLLSPSLDNSSKFYITTKSVHALKSRVATYFKDYSIAKSSCEAILNDFSIVARAQFRASYNPGNAASNSIFELAQYSNDSNGINGLANIYRGTAYGDIQVINSFISDAGFDTDDIRIDPTMIAVQSGRLRNVGKYPSPAPFPDNIKVIRYEEVVLNYAEALLGLNNSTDALTQLNRIVSARETTPTLYTSATIDNILKERRKELCFEGFRFDDLARHGRNIRVIDNVVQTHGGPQYGSYKYAFPIPLAEMDANSSMVQNFGY